MRHQNTTSETPERSYFRITPVLRSIRFLAAILTFWMACDPAISQTSPLGINLMAASYFSPAQPFLNIFKTAYMPKFGWLTQSAGVWDTGEEQSLQLDADGWVKSLTAVGNSFDRVGVLILRSLGS